VLLIYLSCAWVAGIFLGSNLELPLALILAGFVPLLLLFFARRHRKPVILVSLVIFTLLAAAAYSYSSLHTVDGSSLRFYNDRGSVAIRGTVAGDPDVRDKNTRLNLAAAEIKLDKGWQEV